MHIILNNVKTKIEDSSSVSDLIGFINFTHSKFAIAVNQSVIPFDLHETTILVDGDVVDIVVPMQGG